jgi:hypothetical protein
MVQRFVGAELAAERRRHPAAGKDISATLIRTVAIHRWHDTTAPRFCQLDGGALGIKQSRTREVLIIERD